MWRKKASPAPEPIESGLEITDEALKSVIVERDEALDLLTQARRDADMFRESAKQHGLRHRSLSEGIEHDARVLGGLLADRVSAVNLISMCRQIIAGRSASSAHMAAALLAGWSEVKEKPKALAAAEGNDDE